MLIKYEQISIIYLPFFSVLADLPIVDYDISTENRPFSWKIPIFSNFGPLRRAQDIKMFEKRFDIFKAHIKRQLLVPLNTLTATTFSTPMPQKYVKTLENLCFTFKHAYIFLILFSTCIHQKLICLQSCPYPYDETKVHLHFCFSVA